LQQSKKALHRGVCGEAPFSVGKISGSVFSNFFAKIYEFLFVFYEFIC